VGYTHYWYRPIKTEIDQPTWDAICEDARTLIAATTYRVVLDYDLPISPRTDKDLIRFNGLGDLGHETFYLPRVTEPQVDWRLDKREVFAFCKTAYKPYDELVCAVLAVIAERCPAVKVSSDGQAVEWEPAMQWASEKLGRRIEVPKLRHEEIE